ncbi:hypothetical protein [Nocardia sp. XZ_19_385]|uniref:hypothetical protein n=1 Tax=Nocardia sp. XZ_19_385 TaxID=2769488 RepID=UPI00189031B4|nr:hypothetical protein [Nocardia sp. XZ_19_385]
MIPGTGLVPDNSDDQPELDQSTVSDATNVTHMVVYAHSGSAVPRSRRQPKEEVDPGPADPTFADLMFEPCRRWAVAVAENFVFLANRGRSISVEECWIDTELALCVRYSTARGIFGGRWADPYLTHISWLSPLNPLPTGIATSARWQASNFLDVHLDGGEPAGCEWTEDDGRKWVGPAPGTGWPSVVDPASRMITIAHDT